MTCVSGSIYDIIVDLRPESKTYLKWESIDLNPKNRNSLHIPKGCANAFLTIKNNTVVVYFSSTHYNPNFEKGIRYNDPLFNFNWPVNEPQHITEKDNSWPDFIPE